MKRSIAILYLAGCMGFMGCASVDRLGAKMDMEAEHLVSDKPIYEGQVRSVAVVGAMTSIQFFGGKVFEVSEAPRRLEPNDIVRIYEGKDGYVAHLWVSAESALPSAEANTLAPRMSSSN